MARGIIPGMNEPRACARDDGVGLLVAGALTLASAFAIAVAILGAPPMVGLLMSSLQ